MTATPTPPRPKKRRRWILILAVIVVIVIATHHSSPSSSNASGSAQITHTVTSVVPIDDAHVRVYTTWGNTGTVAGTVSCTIHVTAENVGGDDIGSGFDTSSPNTPVDPGATEPQYQDVVITDNNAYSVTDPSEVTIDSCS